VCSPSIAVQFATHWKRLFLEKGLMKSYFYITVNKMPATSFFDAHRYRQVHQSFKRAGINIDRMGGRTLRNSFAAQEHLSGTSAVELMGKLGLFKDTSLEIYVDAATNNQV
jgi:hypothetical protein